MVLLIIDIEVYIYNNTIITCVHYLHDESYSRFYLLDFAKVVIFSHIQNLLAAFHHFILYLPNKS